MKMGSRGRDKEQNVGSQQIAFPAQAITRDPEMLLNITFKFEIFYYYYLLLIKMEVCWKL